MKVSTNWVPSAFTLANMFCGFYSVVSAANGKIIQACWLIVASAVLDSLDGKIARFANASSHFGVEYDSLADVISFGFAPSFLIYKTMFADWGTIGLFVSAAPLLFGSIRLARFNARLEGFDKSYFEGIPIPAQAVTLASFIVFNIHHWGYLRWEKLFLAMVIILSVLMVSSLRYETMPNFSLQQGKSNRWKFLVVIIGSALIIIFPQEALFPISVLYALSGPFNFSKQLLSSENKKASQNKEKKNESSRKSKA